VSFFADQPSRFAVTDRVMRLWAGMVVATAMGCSGKPAATNEPAQPRRFVQITPKMTPDEIAQLGAKAFQLCHELHTPVNPLRGDRSCRWAYLYTAVACNRGRYVSCLLAGRLARQRYGDDSKVATEHLETACKNGVQTACQDLEENRFAKPPPGDNKTPRTKHSKRTCDEVSCLLASKQRPCCNRFKKKKTTTTTTPGRLGRAAIAAAIRRVRPRVVRCNTYYKAKGRVSLRIHITPQGRVSSASVTSTPHNGLGRCVAAVVRTARFPRSRHGANVVYPFVFR